MTAVAARPPGVHEGATRVDGPDKVAGRARYAAEHPMAELAYACPVTSTVARGRDRADRDRECHRNAGGARGPAPG